MVTAPILVFPNWSKDFHVHVDSSYIALGAVLSQLGARDIDHSLAFYSKNLSTTEINFTTTKREGLGHFKMFTDHSALKYLVNKPVLGGMICRWIFLF
jgi:hypothetical protein